MRASCTTSPPKAVSTLVIAGSASGGTVNGSAERTARSASLPGSSVPFSASACSAYALPRVYATARNGPRYVADATRWGATCLMPQPSRVHRQVPHVPGERRAQLPARSRLTFRRIAQVHTARQAARRSPWTQPYRNPKRSS
jgi:hypothetical protein